MRTLVLGASGQIGAYTVQDLVEFYEAEVIAASRRLANVKNAMKDLSLADRVKIVELDANNVSDVTKMAKSETVDTIVNCAWYQTNLSVMEACMRAGVHYTDLGGLFDTTLKQLDLDAEWKDAGINATIGLGSTRTWPEQQEQPSSIGSTQSTSIVLGETYCQERSLPGLAIPYELSWTSSLKNPSCGLTADTSSSRSCQAKAPSRCKIQLARSQPTTSNIPNPQPWADTLERVAAT